MLNLPARLVLAAVLASAGTAAHAEGPAVTAELNLAYAAGDPTARLDVFHPADGEATGPAWPTVVWVHGGAFVQGTKDEIAAYLKRLAAEGFTTVGVDYELAPAARYPRPVEQVNAALAYLVANAVRLRVDPDRLFLAGDSAGAQIAGQVTNLVSSPAYAAAMGIVPAIERRQLRGAVLFCGIYDPEALNLKGDFAGLLKTVSRSYLGTEDLMSFPRLREFSVVRNVSAGLPPLFVSVGNGDPLAPHSYRLAEAAAGLGVPVETLFFPEATTPPLPHEYQFEPGSPAAEAAFARVVAFLRDKAD